MSKLSELLNSPSPGTTQTTNRVSLPGLSSVPRRPSKLQQIIDQPTPSGTFAPTYTPTQITELSMPFRRTVTQSDIDNKSQQIDQLKQQRYDTLFPTFDATDPRNATMTSNIQANEEALSNYKNDLFYRNLAERRTALESAAKGVDLAAPKAAIDTSTAGEYDTAKDAVKYLTDPKYKTDMLQYATDATQDGVMDAYQKYTSYDKMTEAERQTLLYYALKKDWKSAQEYIQTIRRDLNARYADELRGELYEFSKENKGAAALVNVVNAPRTALSFVGTAAQNIENAATGQYTPIDPNSASFTGSIVDESTSAGIKEGMSPLGGFLTDVGLSTAKYVSTLPLGPQGTLFVLSSEAAGQSAYQATQNGASPEQALTVGTIAGVIEYATEKIPLDNLLKIKDVKGFKDVIRNTLKQAGMEGTEEVVAEYLNSITDEMIMGSKSQVNRLVEQYMSQGMSRENAVRKAVVEVFAINPMIAGAAGTLSGGFLGSGRSLVINILTQSSDANVAKRAASLQEQLNSTDINVAAQAQADATIFLNDISKIESVVRDIELKLSAMPQSADTVSAYDILNRRRQIQQQNYASARETLSRMSAENQVVSLANAYLTSDSLSQMEQAGVMTDEISALRKSYNKAFQIQQRINWLTNNGGSEKEIAAAERSLKGVTPALEYAQAVIANYFKSTGIAAPVVATQPNTPEVSMMPQDAPQAAPMPRVGQQPSTQARASVQPQAAQQASTGYLPVTNDTTERLILGPTPQTRNTTPGMVERGFTENVRTDTAMQTDIRQSFDTTPEMYRQLANRDTLSKAEFIFNRGVDTALSELNQRIGENKITPADVPLSRMIANDLAKRGDVDGARRVLSDVAVLLTEAGQLTQAAAILKNTDPASVEQTVKKAFDKINEELKKRGAKFTAELTEAELQQMYNTDFSQEGAFEAFYDQVARRVGSEMGSTLWEKMTEIRRISMLLNPKTQVRNILGNVPMALMRKASTRIAGGIQDALVSKGRLDKAKQTRTFKVSAESKAIARELFDANKEALTANSNKWDMNSLVRQYRKYFGQSAVGKAVDNVRAFTYYLLEQGDIPFLRSAFVNTAAQYIEAQGYKTLDDVPFEVTEAATKDALEATFRDASLVANLLNRMKAQSGLFGKGLDVIVPFTTTPINIARRTYEYSPLGAIKVVTDIATKQDVTKTIDDLTKTMTGTAVVAFGFALRGLGLITGAPDEDRDKAAWKRATGISPYSFLGKVSYEWSQPTGSLMAIGAQIWESAQDGEGVADAIWKSITSAGDAYLNLTFFKSVLDLLQGYGSPTENLLSTILTSGVQQFAPSAVGAVARIVDPTVRTSYTGQGTFADILAGTLSKTPGASRTLPASVSVRGEDNRRVENPLLRAVQELLNPASVNTGTSTAVDSELQRLYDATENNGVFPKLAANKIEANNTTYTLTGDEKSKFQKTMGQTTYRLLGDLIEGKDYEDFTDEQKAAHVANAIGYAYDRAKKELVESRGDTYESQYKDLNIALQANVPIDKYYKAYDMYRSLQNDKSLSATEKANAFAYMVDTEIDGLTQKQKDVLQERLSYVTIIPQSADRYNNLASSGVSSENAIMAYETMAALPPDTKKDTKLSTITSMDLSDTDKLSVIKEYFKPSATDNTYTKYATASAYNISVSDYTTYLKNLDANGNNSISEKEAIAALRGMNLNNKQKALLFAMTNKTFTKKGGNPYMSGFTYDKITWAE